MTQRDAQISRFLQGAGWHLAQRAPLAGDASARQYHRLHLQGLTAILMDNSPGTADDPAQFVRVAAHLASLGLSAPRILAQNLPAGLLLLEDLNDGVFARILANDPAQEITLYRGAVDVLAHIQSSPALADLQNLSAADWAGAAMLAPRHYGAAIMGAPMNETALESTLIQAISHYADGPRVMILRDYHAENLLDLPLRTGLAKVGILDFQLAQMGQPAYDLVSLLQDARRDVAPQTQAEMLRHWLDHIGATQTEFSASYAVLGAQRALRILGIFAQLCTHHGKPAYLPLLPRVWSQLHLNLAHPALADLAKACASLPPPTQTAIAALRSQCKTRH